MAKLLSGFTRSSSELSPTFGTESSATYDFHESSNSRKDSDARGSSGTSSTTSSRRSEQILSDAAAKINNLQESLYTYKSQYVKAIEEKQRLEEENEFLRQAILTQALENASIELRREHMQLKQTLNSYRSKMEQMKEISLLTAKVVDSRIRTKQGRQYVEYKLQIETDIRGSLVLWHRYSTFLNLAATLKSKNPTTEHQILELQTQSLTGYFSDRLMLDRIARLNEFLDVVTQADEFQWGIRIDKDTCVYKRRGRNSGMDSVRESISTLSPHMVRDSVYGDGLIRPSISSYAVPM
uniref:Myosinlike protein putative n=1 Tax=Albugo laibachii Nc14 TaxID=890382 RepID=F0W6Z3_9STRA|nr:myosinlike protein putative [Albugo laibachii Nc14]|eukprot:CCA16888.1 myosinlike protein putative [Albugo laibachii Nc14]